MINFFKIVWVFDALISVVVLVFFFIGLTDGTVSSFNLGLWFCILAALSAIMFGSIWLRSHQQRVLAVILLLILAIPGFFYLVFMCIMIFGGVKWQ